MKAPIRNVLGNMWQHLYFAHNRAVWTDDAKYEVVQLRNKITDLIEDRIGEITGVTEAEEFYLLARGDDRHALARIRGNQIIEGTYFEPGWPGDLSSGTFQVSPWMLEIRGRPYRITMTRKAEAAQVILTVENSSSDSDSRERD